MLKFASRFTHLPLVLILTSAAIASLPTLAIAQTGIRFNAPSIGSPGNREAGAVRSDSCAESTQDGLTAVLPETNLGLTTEDYPTFFAYVPRVTTDTAEFALYNAATDELVYRTSISITENPAIVSIPLPNDGETLPLAVGEDYYWYFSVICNPNDRAADMLVQGGVQRVAVDSALARQLETSTPQDYPVVYAEAGIWQDALSELADLRRTHPNDSISAERWQALLAAVGLENLADEPIF